MSTFLFVLLGIVAGLATVQMFRFVARGGKLYIRIDETPVSRRVFAVAVVIVVTATVGLFQIDVNTRDCLEETRALLLAAQSGDPSGLTENHC